MITGFFLQFYSLLVTSVLLTSKWEQSECPAVGRLVIPESHGRDDKYGLAQGTVLLVFSRHTYRSGQGRPGQLTEGEALALLPVFPPVPSPASPPPPAAPIAPPPAPCAVMWGLCPSEPSSGGCGESVSRRISNTWFRGASIVHRFKERF